MLNAIVTFGFLPRNAIWIHYYFLVFQPLLGMSIKGTRVRYSDILTLLSIFKGTVNMN